MVLNTTKNPSFRNKEIRDTRIRCLKLKVLWSKQYGFVGKTRVGIQLLYFHKSVNCIYVFRSYNSSRSLGVFLYIRYALVRFLSSGHGWWCSYIEVTNWWGHWGVVTVCLNSYEGIQYMLIYLKGL